MSGYATAVSAAGHSGLRVIDVRLKAQVMADLARLDISMHDMTAAFQVPKEWILLQRTILLLTGPCTHRAPEMRLFVVLWPYLEEYVLGADRSWMNLVSSAVVTTL